MSSNQCVLGNSGLLYLAEKKLCLENPLAMLLNEFGELIEQNSIRPKHTLQLKCIPKNLRRASGDTLTEERASDTATLSKTQYAVLKYSR